MSSVQKLAIEAEPAAAGGAPVLRVAARPGGRSRRGARGSGACARFRAARAAAWCAAAARATSKCVTASRGRSLRVDIDACGARGRGRSGRRSCRVSASGRPSTSARYSRVHLARPHHAPGAPRAPPRSCATSSSPDVSRSSRCTIPARSGSGPPARGRAALRQRRAAVPRRGMRHEARRLVHHEQVGVLVARPRTSAARRRRRRRRLAPRRSRPAPGRDAVVLRPRRAVHRHRPGLDQPLRGRARGDGAARGQERVEPQPGVVRRGGQLSSIPLLASPRPPTEAANDPHDDAGVGDVEGGPRHRVDEVDHRALAGAVGQVAERAARAACRRAATATAVAVAPRSSRSAARARARSGPPRSGRRPRSAPKATPVLRVFVKSSPKNTLTLSPGAMLESTSCLVAWSTATTSAAVASAAAGPARLTPGSGRRPRRSR